MGVGEVYDSLKGILSIWPPLEVETLWLYGVRVIFFPDSRLHRMTSPRECHTAGDNLLTDIYTDGTKRRLRYKSEIPLLPTDDEYIYIFNERQTRTPTISETAPVADKDHDQDMTTFNHSSEITSL